MDYNLRLGHLVSVWTTHVSNADSSAFTVQNASLMTSIFPERDRSCHLMMHDRSDEGVLCKTPLGYREGRALAAMMTLKNFSEAGSDVKDATIVVCVKSIGPRKKCTSSPPPYRFQSPDTYSITTAERDGVLVTTKKGKPAEKVDVKVFDDTYEATLTLWGCVATSAATWKPSHTILLISNPGLNVDGRVWLGLKPSTQVDVDPCMEDAEWLREYAHRLVQKNHVNEPFPQGGEPGEVFARRSGLIETVFDMEGYAEAENRMLFTLAEVVELYGPLGFSQEVAEAYNSTALGLHRMVTILPGSPSTAIDLLIETIMGYLNLVIMELNLVTLHRRDMLLCNEWYLG